MMRLNVCQRQGGWRWVVVVSLFVAFAVLAEVCLVEIDRRPWLGVEADRQGSQLVVSRVQPACLAWDAGIRAGQIIVAVDGQPTTEATDLAVVDHATTIEVQAEGTRVRASVASAREMAEQRCLSFLIIAAEWLVVGGIVFVLAADVFAAGVMMVLSAAAAAALIASIATPFGAPWALATVYIAVTAVGASLFLLFLVFPINRFGDRWGRWMGLVCIGAALFLSLSYGWMLIVEIGAADLLHYLHRGAVALDLLGAMGLVLAALVGTSLGRGEAKRALGLVALGTLAGLTPFCLLSLIPQLMGIDYLVSPDITILSVALLPASMGVALLGKQFLGIRRIAQRGLIALIVWLALLTAYSLGLRLLIGGPLDSVVLKVAIVAGTFGPLQQLARARIEHFLLSDVYKYAETLQQLAAEIAVLTGVDAIAEHVLTRLRKTLDLSWVAIVLRDSGSEPLLYQSDDCPRGLAGQLTADKDQPLTVDGKDLPYEHARLFTLVSEGAAIGELVTGPKRREADLSPDDETLIATLAPLIATALRNALLVRDLGRQVVTLGERESALAALSTRLMNVQEEERRQLALELHDDPLQRAILLARSLGDAPSNAQNQRWRQAVEEIIVSLRATCTDLHPPVLDDLGLVPGIERLVNSVRARSDLDVRLTVETQGAATFGRLDVGLEVALYRVAQEALYNCLKHARATRVTVNLRRDDEEVLLSVVDDGQGYRPARGHGQSPVHLGILGMRERLRQWDGRLDVRVTEMGGTAVLARVALGGGNGRDL